ncbi:MAG: tRNA(Ile)-lysidine synthetase [Acidimicrobiales bacterium]
MCRQPAIIDIRRHNANFCKEHFLRLCRDQVAKTIDEFEMFGPEDRLLVAVSGGKDSLAVWDILTELGYRADGLYLGLGIGDYSAESAGYASRFAHDRNLRLLTVNLLRDHGFDVPHGARAAGRAPCSACGLSKRHLFDEAARTGGYDAVVTGHNLDDEAAVLMGNTLHWQTEYLGRQRPMLAAGAGFPRKVKPLVRLAERETAAYCLVRGIDYIVDECPLAAGNKHLTYKAALNDIERSSPGAKHAFYFGFLARAAERFRDAGGAEAGGRGGVGHPGSSEKGSVAPCARCGSPTSGDVCAFCRLAETATAPVPVRLSGRRERTGS